VQEDHHVRPRESCFSGARGEMAQVLLVSGKGASASTEKAQHGPLRQEWSGLSAGSLRGCVSIGRGSRHLTLESKAHMNTDACMHTCGERSIICCLHQASAAHRVRPEASRFGETRKVRRGAEYEMPVVSTCRPCVRRLCGKHRASLLAHPCQGQSMEAQHRKRSRPQEQACEQT
jgi:hypothetical protein